jgi:amidophosphoribosyltransferase
MQHRGQEGAGIAAIMGNTIVCHKNRGLASEVFSGNALDALKSRASIGNCQYTVASGGNNPTGENIQPVFTEYLTGRIATVHSGNITNAKILKSELMKYGIAFMGTSDSEVISKLIAYHCTKERSVLDGVKFAAESLIGSFSLIVLSTENNELLAVRDSSGFRPLCIGRNKSGIAVTSESCALDTCGFDFVRDIKPGEVVVVQDGEITYEETVLTPKIKNFGVCIFEYIYFARPDSVIDNVGIFEARVNMGKILAKESPVLTGADVVCGVPDSGMEAAAGYSEESGIPLVTGLMRNRYIGRSFIYPTQAQRENAVRLKFNVLKSNIEGRRVVIVDDSLVRGTSTEKIVRLMKNAGAKETHVRISSPPVKYSCHYGIDTKNEADLIASGRSAEEVRRQIGADSLAYISISGLKEACGKCSRALCGNCFEKR